MASRDWPVEFKRLESIAPVVTSYEEACRLLEVPKTSMSGALARNGLSQHDFDWGEKASGFEYETSANTMTVTGESAELDTFLKRSGTDMDVWKVATHTIKEWDAQTKEAGVVAMQSTSVNFVRKDPVMLFPHVQPVVPEIMASQQAPTAVKGWRRALMLADPHFGYYRDLQTMELTPMHSPTAIRIAIEIARAIQPDEIHVLGDILDLADFTDKFLRSPELTDITQPAIVDGYNLGHSLRTVSPGSWVVFHEGNHGERLTKALIKHLRAAYGLRPADRMDHPPALSVPNLLGLKSLGIEWATEGAWLNDEIQVMHGVWASSVPGSSALAAIKHIDHSRVIGHTHKQELVSRTLARRDKKHVINGLCPGCLCHIDGRVPGNALNQRWQQGVAVIDYELHSSSPPTVTMIPITDGTAVFNGKVYQ